jgi:hypothetical protein
MLRGFRLLAVLSVLSILFATSRVQAAWLTVTPPDAGFSVLLPDTPKPTTVHKPKVMSRIWVTNANNLLCLAGVTDYDSHIDTKTELTLDMKNFLAEVQGTVKSQKRLSFNTVPDGPMPALEFSFVTPKAAGRSLIVVAGDRAYQVVVIGIGDYNSNADAERVFASLKITAPARHWQDP